MGKAKIVLNKEVLVTHLAQRLLMRREPPQYLLLPAIDSYRRSRSGVGCLVVVQQVHKG
jgi:hypothetical protein